MVWIIGGGIYFVLLALSLAFLRGVSILNVENERGCSKVKEITEGDLAELPFTKAQYLLYILYFARFEKITV